MPVYPIVGIDPVGYTIFYLHKLSTSKNYTSINKKCK